MRNNKDYIAVFEHESLRTDRGEKRLSHSQLSSLQKFYGEKGVPYYSLIHQGVKFCEFVGVIQIGKTIIEVLPKADRRNNIDTWKKMLVGMLHAVGIFDIHAPSSSHLSLKNNSILDLYFHLYINELESLLRRGLVKKYRKTEGNTTALKGNINFAKHISQNLVHQERFYVNYATYDTEHILHSILYKALRLLIQINTNIELSSRIGSLLLNFPEFNDVKVSEQLFDKISLDRKTQPYKNALEIARLLLMNYHPDVSKGNNNVLSLMFDMNLLWEKFVYASLRKYSTNGTSMIAQSSKGFWKPDIGNRSTLKPDIVLNKGQSDCIILDTKWKSLNGFNPSPDDLRQMFVYMKYYNAKKVALVYPGVVNNTKGGKYFKQDSSLIDEIGVEECSIISIAVDNNINRWQTNISAEIDRWRNRI
ncbi:MAG TPA: restriction endonuclease [Bacteroidales bacterium]|nr:restriction endonuclease [Bacteroidales bacterium]